jgi:hypothetical protein
LISWSQSGPAGTAVPRFGTQGWNRVFGMENR